MSEHEYLGVADLQTAFTTLGELLTERNERIELVLVGGANLLLRGVISRSTKDGDIVAQRLEDGTLVPLVSLPPAIEYAVREVGDALGLVPDWLNTGPASLMEIGVPGGFDARLERHDYGGLTLWFASEFDMVCFKLYAAADRWPSKDRHFADLRALAPSDAQLMQAATWCLIQDASPGFRGLLVAVLGELGMQDADVRLR